MNPSSEYSVTLLRVVVLEEVVWVLVDGGVTNPPAMMTVVPKLIAQVRLQ